MSLCLGSRKTRAILKPDAKGIAVGAFGVILRCVNTRHVWASSIPSVSSDGVFGESLEVTASNFRRTATAISVLALGSGFMIEQAASQVRRRLGQFLRR